MTLGSELGETATTTKYIELQGSMSKVTVERADDPEVEGKVTKLRTKIVTEETIRLEAEKRRRVMRKMMQQKNGIGNA